MHGRKQGADLEGVRWSSVVLPLYFGYISVVRRLYLGCTPVIRGARESWLRLGWQGSFDPLLVCGGNWRAR